MDDGFQGQLSAEEKVFPDRLHGGQREDEYRLLGVDGEGQGHYWLQSDRLHSVVYSVDEDYDVEGVESWESEGSILEYVRGVNWRSLSEYGSELLDESGKD